MKIEVCVEFCIMYPYNTLSLIFFSFSFRNNFKGKHCLKKLAVLVHFSQQQRNVLQINPFIPRPSYGEMICHSNFLIC